MSQRPGSIVRRQVYSHRGRLDVSGGVRERDWSVDEKIKKSEKGGGGGNPLLRKLSFSKPEPEDKPAQQKGGVLHTRSGPSPSNKMFFKFMQNSGSSLCCDSGDDRELMASPRKEKEQKKKGFFGRRSSSKSVVDKRKKSFRNGSSAFEESSSQDSTPELSHSTELAAPPLPGTGGPWRSGSSEPQMQVPRAAPRTFTDPGQHSLRRSASRGSLHGSRGSLNGYGGGGGAPSVASSQGSFESLLSIGQRPHPRPHSSFGRTSCTSVSNQSAQSVETHSHPQGNVIRPMGNQGATATATAAPRTRLSVHDSSSKKACQNFVLQVPDEVFKGRQRRHLRLLKLVPSILRTATQLSAQLWESAFVELMEEMCAEPLSTAVFTERRRDANYGLLLEGLADDCLSAVLSGMLRYDREAWAGVTRGLVIRVASDTRQLHLRLKECDVLSGCVDRRIQLVVQSVLREMSLRALFNQKLGVRKHNILTVQEKSVGGSRPVDPITQRIDDIFDQIDPQNDDDDEDDDEDDDDEDEEDEEEELEVEEAVNL